jgi:putative transcriptional regulator
MGSHVDANVAFAPAAAPLHAGVTGHIIGAMKPVSAQLAGKCLIAMPSMGDPRFARSVIYMCAHSADGAMGLIVNKPAPDVRLGDLLEHLGIPKGNGIPDIRVHIGGPVEHARGFVLHSSDFESPQGTMKVDDDISMTATLDVLERIAGGTGPRQSILALGYAGWGPGQLESEIAQNGWLTADSRNDLVFGRANEFKWSAALKSIGVDPVTLSSQSGRA